MLKKELILSMIKEITIPKAGLNRVLKYGPTECETSVPDDSVRLKVAFSGVNFADIIMRLGLYPDAPAFPFVPGYEVSGVITEVGKKVTQFKLGDKVFGGTKFNGYSSELILEASQLMLIGDLSLEEAAAMPVSFLTAYIVFFEQGRARQGDKVLIDCATGALGQLSFQMLSNMGLDLVGLTSSENKKDIITSFNARAMTHEEFNLSSEKGFDIILNSAGGSSIKSHYDRLAPTGRVICIGASSLFEDGKRSWIKAIRGFLAMPKFGSIELMNDCKGVMGLNVLKLFDGSNYLINILNKIELFELKPNVDKVFDAKEASKAHAYIESKQARGKVLLKWD